jgi:hypothetical protein
MAGTPAQPSSAWPSRPADRQEQRALCVSLLLLYRQQCTLLLWGQNGRRSSKQATAVGLISLLMAPGPACT